MPLSIGYAFLRWFHRAGRVDVGYDDVAQTRTGSLGSATSRRVGPRRKHRIVRSAAAHPRDRPKLLYVGRIAVEKNLEAFLNLQHDATKVVVGDGPARTELQSRYPDVEWTGYRYGAELAAYYADADVFVFPVAHGYVRSGDARSHVVRNAGGRVIRLPVRLTWSWTASTAHSMATWASPFDAR